MKNYAAEVEIFFTIPVSGVPFDFEKTVITKY
jgi:hypothetical protein